MYRSLYFKIILILIIFVTTVMALVGTVLIGGVSGYFTDDFSNQMDACFSEESELWGYLSSGLENGEGAEALFITLNAYFGQLGLDDHRECAVLSEDGIVLAASAQSKMFAQGETVTLTPNILSVMNGKEGRAQKSGASYLDYCVRLSGGEESVLLYVRATGRKKARVFSTLKLNLRSFRKTVRLVTALKTWVTLCILLITIRKTRPSFAV